MTYLITGATGDVGSRVVRQLIERNIRPRVLVRNVEKAHAALWARSKNLHWRSRGTSHYATGHEGRGHSLSSERRSGHSPAGRGCSNNHQREGARRIVKLSSLDVDQGLAIGAWHEKGEAALRAFEISFTFVRPSGFMTNLPA